MKKILLTLIRWYQRVFSPDTGAAKGMYVNGGCRFVPSCSHYASEAIEKHGALKGVLKAIWRILRCNPFGKGGVDLP